MELDMAPPEEDYGSDEDYSEEEESEDLPVPQKHPKSGKKKKSQSDQDDDFVDPYENTQPQGEKKVHFEQGKVF